MLAVRSLPKTSTGGPGGICLQNSIGLLDNNTDLIDHLKLTLLTVITAFMNYVLQVHCSAKVVLFLLVTV